MIRDGDEIVVTNGSARTELVGRRGRVVSCTSRRIYDVAFDCNGKYERHILFVYEMRKVSPVELLAEVAWAK